MCVKRLSTFIHTMGTAFTSFCNQHNSCIYVTRCVGMWRDVLICDVMGLYVSNTSVNLHTNNRTTFASFYNQYGSCICVTRQICMCGMTPPCVCRAPRQISFMTVTWLIYVWHVSFVCLTWLMHMCDMTHLNEWHVSFICKTWLRSTCHADHTTE